MSKQDKDGCALRIFKFMPLSSTKPGDTRIVICRPYAFLERELKKAFKGLTDVTVTVDRRQGERRKSTRLVSEERRKIDRRKQKAELLEVFIST